MNNVVVSQTVQQVERRIGGTTYVVTAHFQKQGTTAVDKIRSLLSANIKPKGSCHK